MNEISELDLQNLRHLIGGFTTTHCKMQAYAGDRPRRKAVFPEISTVCNGKQTAAYEISAVAQRCMCAGRRSHSEVQNRREQDGREDNGI